MSQLEQVTVNKPVVGSMPSATDAQSVLARLFSSLDDTVTRIVGKFVMGSVDLRMDDGYRRDRS